MKRTLLILALGAGLAGCSASAGDASPSATATTPPPPVAQESPAANSPSPEASPSPGASPSPEASPSPDAKYHGLVPFPDVEAPEITEVVPVLMKTDVGELHLEIYPQAAPNSAKRFLELVKAGYYNDTPIFRVIRTPEPFMAQFGINWRKAGEREKTFKEDPTRFQLDRGTLAFAKTGAPDSASTQVFINYQNNDRLRAMNFTVFGRVVKGMEVADKFKEGELDQMRMWAEGEKYMKGLSSQPDKILKMEVVKPKEADAK